MIDISQPSTTTLYDATRNATLKILDSLEPHKRTIIRDIIDTVVAQTGCPSTIANGLIPMFCHDWADAGNGTVERGRLGGVYKGGPRVRSDQRPRCETCHQVLRQVKVYPGSIEEDKEST
jgi:hypothetical protein